MSEDMSAYVYAGTHASSQNDIATETPMVHANINDGFIAGEVRHEVGYVGAFMYAPTHSVAYTNAFAFATTHDPEDGSIYNFVGDETKVSTNISEDARIGQCFANLYNKFTCSAACYGGNDDN